MGEETFFTVIGCMDGRCQKAVVKFGRDMFDAEYADAITEPGLVGTLAQKPSKAFLKKLQNKVEISVYKHHSKAIIVDGHAECSGDPVDDESHREHVKQAVAIVRKMILLSVPVVGVFAHRKNGNPRNWVVDQLDLR